MATIRTLSSSAAISTPVSTARASSVLAARTTWRSASATSADGKVTASVAGSACTGIVVEAQRTDRELRPAGADVELLPGRADLDRTHRQRPHDVGDEPGRHDHRTVAAPRPP